MRYLATVTASLGHILVEFVQFEAFSEWNEDYISAAFSK
jgi:hypothetical protein